MRCAAENDLRDEDERNAVQRGLGFGTKLEISSPVMTPWRVVAVHSKQVGQEHVPDPEHPGAHQGVDDTLEQREKSERDDFGNDVMPHPDPVISLAFAELVRSRSTSSTLLVNPRNIPMTRVRKK